MPKGAIYFSEGLKPGSLQGSLIHTCPLVRDKYKTVRMSEVSPILVLCTSMLFNPIVSRFFVVITAYLLSEHSIYKILSVYNSL